MIPRTPKQSQFATLRLLAKFKQHVLTMHGRVKVKTSREKEEEAARCRTKELTEYQRLWTAVNELRQLDLAGNSTELLQLSLELLLKNPDVYTLFSLRRRVILHASKGAATISSLENHARTLFVAELELTKRCLLINPKSYGVWYHRRWVMQTMTGPDWRQELKLCNFALDLDERNFHCWDYRRFVVDHGGVPTLAEFAYTREKIIKNFSNYSAWHYRSNLLENIFCDIDKLDSSPANGNLILKRKKLLEDELELINSAMYTDPGDEAVWHYSKWLLHFVVKHRRLLDADDFDCMFRHRLCASVAEVLELEPNARRPLAMSLELVKTHMTTVSDDAVAAKRLSLLCEEDRMRKQCYKALYDRGLS